MGFWPGPVGLKSEFFVLYFPVIFAFALVFTRAAEVAYTGLAMILYTATCLILGVSAANTGADFKLLVMRLIVMAAMGFLGNFYFRIQRDRLRKGSEGDASGIKDLQDRLKAGASTRARA